MSRESRSLSAARLRGQWSFQEGIQIIAVQALDGITRGSSNPWNEVRDHPMRCEIPKLSKLVTSHSRRRHGEMLTSESWDVRSSKRLLNRRFKIRRIALT